MAGLRTSAAIRFLSHLPPYTRSFSAATAAAVDYYDTEWEEDERRRTPPEPYAAWGDTEVRGVQWLFMGAPGEQRRVCATRVAELLEVPYISMGSLVRQELHPRSAIYTKIANAVNEGKLVPESIIFGLLSKRLEEGYLRGDTGFILEGIPRTRMQAEILDRITDVDLVVNFKCVENGLLKKQFGGGVCLHCGKPFDVINSESTSVNPCLATRTRHSQLKPSAMTDTDEIRMEKISLYNEQNKLLEKYYRKQHKLLEFQVSGGAGETWRGLLAALHLQYMDDAGSSRKLTV